MRGVEEMIPAADLTGRYASKVAVDRATFEARHGRATGFLGPNGAGRPTTMRAVVGLDLPDAGRANPEARPGRTRGRSRGDT